MKRHVYLAMKGLEEARGIFSRVWQGKLTATEEIYVEDSLGHRTYREEAALW